MSCDRRCFDKSDPWYGHEDCRTCPGQDSGLGAPGKKSCAACGGYHDPEDWPHRPEPPQEPAHAE